MNPSVRKAGRLHQIEAMLLAHPEGLTQAEIARRLSVNRSTINRYVADLPAYIYVDDMDGGKWKLDRSADLIHVHLNLHEATAMHLASRLLATCIDRQNPHAASALRKMAVALERLAPHICQHLAQSADAIDEESRWNDQGFLRSLEVITLAWAAGRKVKLWYRARVNEPVKETIFSPYFIEPGAVGRSTYVIGFSEHHNALRTLKIERIERVEALREAYTIPADFDPRDLLKYAWGIWYTDEEPVEVVLKFSARVAQRLGETRWHCTEQVEPLADGSLLWRAKIAEPQEMMPWIRGWGADVEVLEPVKLRALLEEEVRRMSTLYEVGDVISNNDLIAHRRERDGLEQSLMIHLTETSQLAERFAAKVGLSEVGKIMGLLHDFGKASNRFQGYLRSNLGLINPDEDGYVDAKRGEVDHSTAGAQLAYAKLVNKGQEGRILAQFLALAIASHHSGLIDCLKPDGANHFGRRITKEDKDTHMAEARNKLPDIEQQIDEILSQPIEKQFTKKIFDEIKEPTDSKPTLVFKQGLLARFLLSCLLDADRLNTADFEKPDNEVIRNYGQYISWEILIGRLEAKFDEYARNTAQMPVGRALEVNQMRAQVAQACLDFAKRPKGIYQLTVPTGGGKTLASLRFALHHAKEYNLERIFYVVPYTTIIDQNAKDLRKVLRDEDENDKPLDEIVLEHHSNFVPEDDTRRRHNLLAENWDAPVVFTTQVQFLEALFGSGTRDARRMHQLANSVIIFDEVQTIPIRITHMFTTALRFLTHDCGATVVLCTATQPPFDKLDNTYRELKIAPEQHIIQNESELFKKLRRVEVHDERKPGGATYAEIAELTERALDEKGSVLIVVNTRASALGLYQQIKARNLGVKTYHLSTNMCPAHRIDVLENKIKPKLKAKEPVICVSTQLIEAGVDIDFGAVIRALAGLDSIAQAAGRCNRHGEREGLGSVWVVNLQEENLDQLKDIKAGSQHAQRLLDDFRDNPKLFGDDRIGLDAIAKYYDFYYQSHNDEMNYPVGANSLVGKNDNLYNLLSMNELSTKAYQAIYHSAPDFLLRQSFRTANGEFRVIDSPTRGVIVPYKNGERVITELCSAFGLEKKGQLLKQAQRYSVNLYEHQFRKLLESKAIQEVQGDAGIYYLNEQNYSEEFGWSDKPVSNMTVLIK